MLYPNNSSPAKRDESHEYIELVSKVYFIVILNLFQDQKIPKLVRNDSFETSS